MKELDPIEARRNDLPFIVRDYLELGEDINKAHDEEERQSLSRSRLDLITDILADPVKKDALEEFVIFQANELKKRGEK